ncbi:hypothetical protein ACKWTF_000165 [Chironomus riparius]
MQKTVITRKDAQEAKIKTRSMAKESEKKVSLKEAKRNSRQKMLLKGNDTSSTAVKDIYGNALSSINMVRGRSGVIYDESMTQHFCLWDQNYPECPERFTSVINRCNELELFDRCIELKPRLATKNEILSIHTEKQYDLLQSTRDLNNEDQLEDLCSQYDAIFMNPSTFNLALLACGSTIELVDNILDGTIQNGMAIIRPPGHHAMKAEYNGYCFFNNVAVAAKHALDNKGVKRILIFDWDVHHGQGSQRAFYDDPRVVYFSIHRYEFGTFWPNLRESDFDYIGSGDGEGKNINVPLNKIGMTNADYLAIFQQLLMPVAVEFQPELIFISAGYDAAFGCPEGEMEVTPACYSHLLSPLMSLANGRIAVVLEGGYCLESLAEGAALTLKTLLGDPCPKMEPLQAPCESIQDTILNCIYSHRQYWKNLCLQDIYNIEELNNVNPQSNLHHVPHDSFIGGDPVPERFLTRNCYPVQNEAFRKNVAGRLMKLRFFTNLSFPVNRVCYVYDDVMLQHKNNFENGHPEQPERIRKIKTRFNEYNLLERMKYLPSRQATEEELLLVHSKSHLKNMQALEKCDNLAALGEKYNSVYFHPKTYECAKYAAGSVLQVVDEVLNGKSLSGVCVVRPPGHHSEEDQPHGFCIFNNVSVAAQYAIKNHGLKRVLIVDWDVHYGQGTKHIFENDPKVLYISVHRYDDGHFFPRSTDANYTEVGSGNGKGFNVNIPWNKKGMGDMEYSLTFQNVIMPIAYEFDPELVFVSAGFDAAIGDPLGGCKVSPEAYGHFTHWLSSLANGKIILLLEGGYNVNSISHSMTLCAKSLLGDPLPTFLISSRWNGINSSALETLKNVINTQETYWKCLKFNKKLPDCDDNENKMQDDLVKDLESIKLTDSDDKGNQSHSSNMSVTSSSDSCEAGSSKPVEKKQTLTDFLNDNLEALNNEEMYAVVPLKNCPHLSLLRPEEAPESIDHTSECTECHTSIENWVCLTCYKTFCSRYINEHSHLHFISSEEPLTLSFSDLSVWCYKCEAYVDNPQLYKYKNLVHRSKFGEDLVWSYGDIHIDLTQTDDDDSE